MTEPGVEPTSSGCITGDRTTDLKSSAVMIGTGIHRLIYWDICVAATAHNRRLYIYIYMYLYPSCIWSRASCLGVPADVT